MSKRLPARLRVLDDLPPVYHSYALFGVGNEQLPGMYALNQKSKQPIILGRVDGFNQHQCARKTDDG
jgi:hypothetical protein